MKKTHEGRTTPSKLFVAAVLALALGAAVHAQDKVWLIGARTLPAPAGASDVLQDAIAATPQPDMAERIRRGTRETKQQWLEVIRAVDARDAERVQGLIAHFSLEVDERDIAGVTVRTVVPPEIAPEHTNRLFIHVHGGAYVFGSGKGGLAEAALIAHHAKIRVASIDYRMPPERPFPAAVDDVVAVWTSLLRDHPASSMALGGTSTGGGLTLASVHRFRELGLETPGALWAGTPWSDLTKTGDSCFTNEGADRALVAYEGVLEGAAHLYADGRDLKTPLLSPVSTVILKASRRRISSPARATCS